MKLPKLEEMNSEQFLDEAFKPEFHNKWLRDALLRRNIYLWFFLTGIACVFITALTNQMLLSILSLFLATVSLVVMTKYDTQLFFLRGLKLSDDDPVETVAD
ncbi:MAG: hypothetical protein V3V05_06140 [Pontiella sp.]